VTITTGPDRKPPALQLPPELSPRRTPAPVVDKAEAPVEVVRPQISRRGLTAAGGAVIAMLAMCVGVAADAAFGHPLGVATSTVFLVVCGAIPLLVRRRVWVTPLVLAPLLWGGAATVLALSNGQNANRREVVLDVATMLTITAPVLYAGTILAVAVFVGRLAVTSAARQLNRPDGQATPAARMSRRSSGGNANSRLSSAETTSSTSV
jgi:hypothetical protein